MSWVMVGMGERTSPQAVSQLARALFAQGAATRVLAAQIPKSRGAMHLDTVFTFADRDCVLLAPDFLAKTTTFSYRPSNHPSGVEFVALGKAVFDDPSQAAAIVTRVNAELDEKAPRFED